MARWQGRLLACLAAVGAMSAVAPAALAQNIVLDRQVRAGELTLFPSVRDDKVFYYAPSRPRLAVENGKPQFSFLRYVENAHPGEGDTTAREGAGGGIVHALVTLSVSEIQLETARQALEDEIPGARIEGPVSYSSGTFGLVSSFADEEGEFTRTVVGLGKAPLLDNSKAAVSIHLTKLGAKVLWESFHTPTPDISFQFEMELEGYRSPVSAVIEADFDRMYQHESIEAAVSGELGGIMLAGEINKTMEDLYESKAIKLTQIGEDEKLEELIQTGYRKLVEIMFQPPNESLAQLAQSAQQRQSLLDRASGALNRRRQEVARQNRDSRERNEERRRRHGEATGAQGEAARMDGTLGEFQRDVSEKEREVERAEEHLAELRAQLRALAVGTREVTPSPDEESGDEAAPGDAPPPSPPGDEASPPPAGDGTPPPAGDTDADRDDQGGDPPPTPEPPPAPEEEAEADSDEDQSEREREREREEREAEGREMTRAALEEEITAAEEELRTKRAALDAARQRLAQRQEAVDQAHQESAALAGDREQQPLEDDDRTEPWLSVAASYQLKEVRQRGVFRIDLNKYTTDTRSFPFSENIGDLREYTEDPDFFRSVNLDDPFYRQREIAVFVDGLDGSAFGEYINFVSVLLRKQHDSGEESLEEVRIDRDNFSAEGNDFRMVYGWKNDSGRESWLQYEWKPTWSFHGGREVQGEWTPASAGAISLSPPYRPRRVTLDADPDMIKDAGVRAITVRLYYDLAGAEQTKQVTLNAMRGELSGTMPFMLPVGSEAFDYEITWRLRGNRQVSSGRQNAVGNLLFVDELPEEAL